MSNQPPSTSTLLPHDSGPPSANMSVPSQPPNGGQSGTFGIPGGGQSTGVPPQNLNNIVSLASIVVLFGVGEVSGKQSVVSSVHSL